jgi:hypothetical protein
VPIDHPEPAPVLVPDINELSAQENELMLQQYRERGDFVDRYAPAPDVASVEW